MKNLLLSGLVLLFIISTVPCFGQNVTITPNGITPAVSGDLPRLTYDEILALPTPSVGDMAIDLTYKTLRFYNGSDWVYFLSASQEQQPLLTGFGLKGDSTEYITSIDFDSNDNICMAGIFNGTLKGVGNVTYTGGGSFIVKSNLQGEISFAKVLPGTLTILDMVLDDADNMYVTGYFTGTHEFSPSLIINSAGNNDMFTAKFDSNGNPIWAISSGGTERDVGLKIILDTSGDVVVCGEYNGVASFSGLNLSSEGSSDIFLTVYNSSTGALSRINRLGGTGHDELDGLSLKSNGEIVLGGSFTNTLEIGADTYTDVYHNPHFIATLNLVSNTWVDSFVLKTGCSTMAFEIDSIDNVLVSGFFEDSVMLNGANLAAYSGVDEGLFVVKLDDSETLLWKHFFETDNSNQPLFLKLDKSSQDVYLASTIPSDIKFYDKTISDYGNARSFFAKISSFGTYKWSRSFRGISAPNGLAFFEGDDSMYGFGLFINELGLDNIIISPTNFSEPISENELDSYVIKIQE
ncbi:hypothetical protein [uncultured Arcticibacterium sp.]|uniref:hypothetical protein n=1 Tax=uncultured Arcticibacterium sp. TaxID=2173042 RepID=UPI0030F594C0